MTLKDFAQLVNDQCDHMTEVLDTKGNDYRGDEDALANFKAVGFRNGLTSWQVWGVYFGKHIMAIERFIASGKLESEPIEERITDAQNYLMLLLALVKEQKGALAPPPDAFPATVSIAGPNALQETPTTLGKKVLQALGLRSGKKGDTHF